MMVSEWGAKYTMVLPSSSSHGRGVNPPPCFHNKTRQPAEAEAAPRRPRRNVHFDLTRNQIAEVPLRPRATSDLHLELPVQSDLYWTPREILQFRDMARDDSRKEKAGSYALGRRSMMEVIDKVYEHCKDYAIHSEQDLELLLLNNATVSVLALSLFKPLCGGCGGEYSNRGLERFQYSSGKRQRLQGFKDARQEVIGLYMHCRPSCSDAVIAQAYQRSTRQAKLSARIIGAADELAVDRQGVEIMPSTKKKVVKLDGVAVAVCKYHGFPNTSRSSTVGATTKEQRRSLSSPTNAAKDPFPPKQSLRRRPGGLFRFVQGKVKPLQ